MINRKHRFEVRDLIIALLLVLVILLGIYIVGDWDVRVEANSYSKDSVLNNKINALGAISSTHLKSDKFVFNRHYVDLEYGGNGRPGWVRAGDMDGDENLDIVAGGGNALFIYKNNKNPTKWVRYGNLDTTGTMGANGGVLFDVDEDGDLDVVSAKYKSDLGWWKNPGDTSKNSNWSFHRLAGGAEGWFAHDIMVGDLDNDGKDEEFVFVLQQGYWDAPFQIHWYKRDIDPNQEWKIYTVTSYQEGPNNNHAGLDLGDLDRDGDIDIAFSNGWFESSSTPSGDWLWHKITDLYGISTTKIGDVNQDGYPDLPLSAGHHGRGVYWFENPAESGRGTWAQHAIDENVHHPECLAAFDLDKDGDLDIVACDLFFGEGPKEPDWSDEVHNVYIFENLDNGNAWRKHNIAPKSFPSHLLQLADINQDGKMDIVSESAGYSVISYYENSSPEI